MKPRNKLRYEDRRSNHVLFVSHCLLNCNAKFPGSADVAGVYVELLHPIAEAGIGLVQMPCLEIMGWGGVNRSRVIYELNPEEPNADWIQEYPRLCAREADKVVDTMEDYLNCGFEVLGVIYVSDSPTCGLEDTMSFPHVHFQVMTMNIPPDKMFDYEYKSEHVWPALDTSDRGAFVFALYQEVRKRGLPVRFIPFRPSNPRNQDVKNILLELNLDHSAYN